MDQTSVTYSDVTYSLPLIIITKLSCILFHKVVRHFYDFDSPCERI
jgi:hypothetical protein